MFLTTDFHVFDLRYEGRIYNLTCKVLADVEDNNVSQMRLVIWNGEVFESDYTYLYPIQDMLKDEKSALEHKLNDVYGNDADIKEELLYKYEVETTLH